MDNLVHAFSLLFTPGSELSQIVLVTLQMSACSTIISTLIGVPLGVCIGLILIIPRRQPPAHA